MKPTWDLITIIMAIIMIVFVVFILTELVKADYRKKRVRGTQDFMTEEKELFKSEPKK